MSHVTTSTWNVRDVLNWAKEVGADAQILRALERHEIDGFALLNDLDIRTLRSELQVESLGKRSRFVRFINEVKKGQERVLCNETIPSQFQPHSDPTTNLGRTASCSKSNVTDIYESIPAGPIVEPSCLDRGQGTNRSPAEFEGTTGHSHIKEDSLDPSERLGLLSDADLIQLDAPTGTATDTGEANKFLESIGRLSAAEMPAFDDDNNVTSHTKEKPGDAALFVKKTATNSQPAHKPTEDIIDLTDSVRPTPKRKTQAEVSGMTRVESPTSADTSGEESLNFAVIDDELRPQVQCLVNDQSASALFPTIELIAACLKKKLPIQMQVPLKQKAAYRNIFLKYASAMLGRECQPNDLNTYELDELQQIRNFRQFHADWRKSLNKTSIQTPINAKPILSSNAKAGVKRLHQTPSTTQSSDNEHVKKKSASMQWLTKKTSDATYSKIGKNDTIKSEPIMINPDHKAAHQSLYIDTQIGPHLRQHQIEGVRFLWRELTLSSRLKGALLAHTMGLGKTLQIITFLLTLLEANASENYRDQLPKHLQRRPLRILILMPPTLTHNWVDEATKWVPKAKKHFFRFFSIPAVLLPHERLSTIQEWHCEGGILTLGYAMFRLLVENETAQFESKQTHQFRHYLLSPSIVIADEAHALKNPKSSLGIYANSFASTSRIALTGSPLSNNLLEYFHIVNWIDEGFLGSLRDFKSKYVVPIAEGLYKDSSPSETRLARRKLAVIKKLLSSKVHRRDIGVIEADLPNKTEFVLSISMSSIQRQLYQHFLETANEATQANTGLLGRIHILKLICSHPHVLQQSLENRTKVATAKSHQTRQESSLENAALQATVNNLQASDSLFDPEMSSDGLDDEFEDVNFSWARPILQSIIQTDAIELGLKFQISMLIIKLTAQLEEKVLVFSHSLLVLNLIQYYIEEANIPFQRLDGTTRMAARQGMTKSFNDTSAATVFLVSTRAGALGINLQGANRVIILDTDFNPTHEQQAVGRAYRFGQRKHVMVYRFRVAGTYEEKLENQTLWKVHLFNTTIQDKKALQMAEKGLKRYFEPLPSEQQLLASRNVPPAVYRGKDKVLEYVMEEFGDKIFGIALTNTFENDEDNFTEQETAEMDQELQQLRQQQMQPST